MNADFSKLSTTDWAVLAFLLEGECHGFKVAAAFSATGPLGTIWRVQRPQIYRSLEHLVEQQLAKPVRQESGDGPPRSLYAATLLGLETAQVWLQTPVPRLRMGRSELRLKLAFLLRGRNDPTTLIENQRKVYTGLLQELNRNPVTDPLERIAWLWRIEMAQASLNFLDRL